MMLRPCEFRRVLLRAARPAPLVLGLLALACVPAVHDADAPPRLVSLSRSASYTIIELAAAAAVVAADADSTRLPELAAATPLAASPQAAVAQIEQLAPDLVLAVPGEGRAELIGPLRARGIEVRELGATTLDGILARYAEVGIWLHREAASGALAQRTIHRIATLSGSTPPHERPRVVWVLSRAPLVVVGGAGLLHDFLELAGGENPFERPLAPTREITPAELAHAAPDLILETSPERSGSEQLRAARRHWTDLVPNARVERVDRELARLPTLDPFRRIRELHVRIRPPS